MKQATCKKCGREFTVPDSSLRVICSCGGGSSSNPVDLPTTGVGTTFAGYVKIFSAWIKFTGAKCDCKKIELKMNMLGPLGCQDRFDELIEDLKKSADKANLVFSRTIAKSLLRKAIREEMQIESI